MSTFAESPFPYCGDVSTSKSGPGWSSIASGAWPDKHGMKDNSFSGNRICEHAFQTPSTPWPPT
ncbi:alkaline phosphatase family protein [Kribbella catacumbae]|uniref:alkaline phosphatase family protein n=1 Tax=Kribbella catacumbae TaxID=460086 RepID=UPI003B5121E7